MYFIYDYYFKYCNDTYDLVCNILKYEQVMCVINVFIRKKKNLRLTMGFGYFIYSYSLVPVMNLLVWVVTKLVSEHEFSLLILNWCFMFSYTTAVLGCQMSVLSLLILVFCVMFWFYFICLLWMRRRARDAPAAEAVDDVEQSFQDEALPPAPRRWWRGSSGRGVLFQVVFAYVWV